MHRYVMLNLNRKEDALFFGDKFLKEHTKWAKERKEKEDELLSILELSAITSSEVHTGNISDPTEAIAMRRSAVQKEIDRLATYQDVLAYGLSHITEEQKKLLHAFYFTTDKLVNALIHDLANEIGCSDRQVYRLKEQAILDFVHQVRVFIDF